MCSVQICAVWSERLIHVATDSALAILQSFITLQLMKNFRKAFILSMTAALMLVLSVGASSCSSCSNPNETIRTQFGVTVDDSLQILSPKTYSYLKSVTPPPGLVPIVVTVDSIGELEIGSYADDLFDEYCDKKYDGSTFSRRGVLVVVSRHPELVQVRVGSTYSIYTRMKGATAGSKYLTYQENIPEKGLDETCVLMFENTLQEIEYCRNRAWYEQLLTKISIAHVTEFLDEMSTPSEGFFSQFYFRPFLAVVSFFYGMLGNWLLAFACIAILWHLITYWTEELMKRYVKKKWGKDLVRLHLANVAIYLLKAGIGAFLTIPTLAAVIVMSSARMEDIITLHAAHIPFIDTINWHSDILSGMPSPWIILLLVIIFYARYILNPPAYYTLSAYSSQSQLYGKMPELAQQDTSAFVMKGKHRKMMQGFLNWVTMAAASTVHTGSATLDTEVTRVNDYDTDEEKKEKQQKGLFFFTIYDDEYAVRPFYCAWVNTHREALVFSMLVALSAVVLLSQAFVLYFLASWTVHLAGRAWNEWKFYRSMLKGTTLSSHFNFAGVLKENKVSYIVTAVVVALVLLFCIPSPNTKTVETVDMTRAIPQDITGLYFVTEQGGEKVKGVTARVQQVDETTYTFTIYSDMPERRYTATYDSPTATFTSTELGNGRVEFLGQTNHLTIKFSTGWTLQN